MLGNASGTGSIEQYEITDHLGKGGFAIVFEAREKSTGALVAIKKVDKDHVRTTHNVERLRTECAIHSSLRHPHVVRLLRCFEDAQAAYLVLELCPRGSLHRHLRRQRTQRLDEAEARRLVQQLVAGVRYLHTRGIIHRDLKLGNLLLDADANLKIADFGLAVQVRADSPDVEQHTMCGTPSYLAPEQLDGRGYGPPVDVWSIGVVLYTLLAGHVPFASAATLKDPFMLPQQPHDVRYADYVDPPGISPDARHLLAQLLCKDPAARPGIDAVAEHRWLRPVIPPPTHVSMVPLDARRLRPLEHRSRHGVVRLDPGAGVLLQLAAEPRLEFLIPPDGSCLRVRSRGSTGPAMTSQPGDEIHLVGAVPAQWAKVYAYAARLVSLVRQKTPKVTVYSARCKAMLMESGDFEAAFFPAVGSAPVESTMSGSRVTFSEGRWQHAAARFGACTTDRTSELEHARICYAKCMHFEALLQGSPEAFPAVLGSRPVRTPSTHASGATLSSGSAAAGRNLSYPHADVSAGSLSSIGGSGSFSSPLMSLRSLQVSQSSAGTLSSYSALSGIADESLSSQMVGAGFGVRPFPAAVHL